MKKSNGVWGCGGYIDGTLRVGVTDGLNESQARAAVGELITCIRRQAGGHPGEVMLIRDRQCIACFPIR